MDSSHDRVLVEIGRWWRMRQDWTSPRLCFPLFQQPFTAVDTTVLSCLFFCRCLCGCSILAIHFLKNISAKIITRRSLGTGKCLQRLNYVDQHCGQAPFLQIKSKQVLLRRVTRGKAGMSDKRRKLWVILLCYDHFNQWFSGTSCIFFQCTLPVL